MIEWWNSLDTMMKILWAITLSASLIFIIQSLLTFLGAGGDVDFDTDIPDAGAGDFSADGSAEGTGAGLLTFRNLVNFFLGFGWAAILLRNSISSTSVLLLVSIIVGVLLVFLVMMIFKWLSGMQQSGNIDVYKSAAGCEGKVYLTIPGERAGEGKVQIAIEDSVREYNAVTDGHTLPTGTMIRVIEPISPSTLLVEPLETIIV